MSGLDFEQRLFSALAQLGHIGGDRLNLEWTTQPEAKKLKSKIIQVHKEIRSIKKDANAAKKEIRASFAAETAKVGKTVGTEISKALIGKKATGQANARIKNQLRQEKEKQLEPYEQVTRTLDHWLARLDQAKLEIDQWLTDQANPSNPTAQDGERQLEPASEPVENSKTQTPLSGVTISPPSLQTQQEPSSPQPAAIQAKRAAPPIAGVIFALVFGLCALSRLTSEFFDALVFAGLALLCLPTFNQFLTDRGWRMKSRTRFAAFMAGILFVSCTQPPATVNSTSGSQTASGSASTSTMTMQSSSPEGVIAPSPAISPTTATPSIPKSSAVAQAVTPDRTSAKVISTGDGDTLRALVNETTVTVRMACIDAPESAQPQGQQAANRLRQLLPRDAQIELRTVDTDRYGRTVAEVYRNGQSINLQMVEEGQAVVYTQYLDGCRSTRSDYLAAETTAKRQRRAFWSQNDPIMPWDWRQGQRPRAIASPAPAPPAPVQLPQPTASTAQNCDPFYPDLCIPPDSPDLDCGDIAARGFRVVGSDPHRLDRDKDGIGCES